MNKLYKFTKYSFLIMLIGGFLLSAVLICLVLQLPDVSQLQDLKLQTPLKIYTQDEKLIAEFGEQRRTPISISEIPSEMIHAIISTEDKRFYEHRGVDIRGLARAVVKLIATGKKSEGGSTITMQVARNFFLSRKKTYLRKVSEILLALKIERKLSKQEILFLYLNKIYFGKGAYGVEAAADVYYGKSIKELSLPQIAMLAGLPQAPSAINPLHNPAGALKRRNHVLDRMYFYHYIDTKQYYDSINNPISAQYHSRNNEIDADYVAEMVRQELVDTLGSKVYQQGLKVYTTINSNAQHAANRALRKQLLAYEMRHHFKKPIAHVNYDPQNFSAMLTKLSTIKAYAHLYPALVTQVDKDGVHIYIHHKKNTISTEEIMLSPKLSKWAVKKDQQLQDILSAGDIIYVEKIDNRFKLSTLPKISGALVALDTNTGAIISLVGGFDYQLSKFNRATQAKRQTGSAFKPFIYAAALKNGMTAASIINDSPIVLNDPQMEEIWRPHNHNYKFYGPTRLRVGLTKSRNLVSIRILQNIGIPFARNYLERFGFKHKNLPNGLSLALGTTEATPLKLAQAYAIFANGGDAIRPHIIAHIDNAYGNVLYEPDTSKIKVLDEKIAYIINNMLRDAIQTGTGRYARNALKRHDIAGKTGTTNDQFDAWFSGYTNNLVTVTWMGYDEPKSIHLYAAQSALPMWANYMQTVLKNIPETSLVQPEGIVNVRIDPRTGLLANYSQQKSIFEVFRAEYVPKKHAPLVNQNKKLAGQQVESSESEIESLF